MKEIILALLIGLFASSLLYGQVEATTTNDRKVILYDDGTWKYAEIPKAEIDRVSFECEDLVTTTTNKLTDRIFTSSKEVLIISDDGGETGLGIFCIKASSNSIIMIIRVVGSGRYIDDDHEVNILFRDGSKLEICEGYSECDEMFNSDSEFAIYFGGRQFNNRKEFNKLITKEIETMRVWTKNGCVQKDFSKKQSKILMNTLKCLKSFLVGDKLDLRDWE